MWQKKGLLFDIAKYKTSLRQSHGAIPFALHTEGNLFRIFFSSRNEKGQSLPYYIESEIKDGTITLTGEPVGPVFGLGELGSFDDSGIMPICCVKNEGVVYMYYVGWNPQVTVSYRHAIGLAVSHDNGKTFERFSIGPVCDRSLDEPFFNSSPFVMVENGVWRMWYISCTNWQIINNYPEPSYLAKYAESENGIHWKKDGIVCLDYDERAKAIARLSVIKIGDEYNMYFSYRDVADYRVNASQGYKIGLAVSKDGISWDKRYDETGITPSAEGWDSAMIEYPHVFEHGGYYYMLYNGNGFGKDGFGYAIMRKA